MSIGVFVHAPAADAKALAKRLKREKLPSAVEIAGMSLIDLATLSNAVTGRDDGVTLLDQCVSVSGGAAAPLPAGLVAALGALDEERLVQVAARWASSEEFRGLFRADDLAPSLRDLVALCRASADPILFLNVG